MPTFELGPSSATAVQIYPEFNYQGGNAQIRSDHRTKSGAFYMYKWGSFSRFKFDLELVPASDAALINSWWDTNTELLLFITSDSTTEVNSVMITNNETPLRSFNKPYDDMYRGQGILLEGY